MIATGITATAISLYEGKDIHSPAERSLAYLVFTAYTTVKPLPGRRPARWTSPSW